ncbi:MAG TPA: CAP domain-containing protein [Limnochordia bacterium]|nr:CAP domain-containing protein [Limnochordia bacterium]
MKRILLFVVVCVLLVAPITEASWGWWAPVQPNIQPPSSNQPSWPSPNPKPNPQPDPTPNPNPSPNPGSPILPTQPSNPGTGTTVPLPNPSLSSDEQNLINQVNQERTKNGLKALQIDYSLVSLAKQKSHDMAVNNYFSHVSPTLGTVYTMLDRAGVSYSRAGENIARTGTVARAHPLFMNSAGHRANILHSGYTHIGVGILKQGTSYHVTQIFIKK